MYGRARNMSVLGRSTAANITGRCLMQTVFAKGLRDPKMNGAVRTGCCITSVAVRPKFLHAEDILNICIVGSML